MEELTAFLEIPVLQHVVTKFIITFHHFAFQSIFASALTCSRRCRRGIRTSRRLVFLCTSSFQVVELMMIQVNPNMGLLTDELLEAVPYQYLCGVVDEV